jgi:16S rRNA G1207 methylase RsmC
MGDINLASLQSSGKNSLLSCMSNLLRRKGVDIRSVNKICQSLSALDPTKDIFVVKGVRTVVSSLEKFASKLPMTGSDISIAQCNVVIFSIDEEGPRSAFSIIEVRSKKESSLQNFIGELGPEIGEQWQVCSIPDYLCNVKDSKGAPK